MEETHAQGRGEQQDKAVSAMDPTLPYSPRTLVLAGEPAAPGAAAALADELAGLAEMYVADERFAAGTRTVAQAMADTKAFTVVGGPYASVKEDFFEALCGVAASH